MVETINGVKTVWNTPKDQTLNNIKNILIQILKKGGHSNVTKPIPKTRIQ